MHLVFLALLAVTGTLVGAAGKGGGETVLVGDGGEIYRADAGAWKRTAGGGVSTTLVRARGADANAVWGAGASGAPYVFDGTTWNATPIVGSGAIVFASGGPAPAIAFGRHLHVRGAKTWDAAPVLTAAKGHALTAIWAASSRDALAASDDGALYRLTGAKWTAIVKPTGDPADPIGALLAGATGAVIAAYPDGRLARVDKAGVKPLSIDPALGASFHATCATSAKGALLLAGATAIAKLDGARVVAVDTMPAIDDGDAPVALLAAADGSLLVATRAGAVLRRDAKGTWTTAHVDRTPPVAATHAANPPAQL